MVKSTVSQRATRAVFFYHVHVWKAWFTCVCWSKHTEQVDSKFLNVRELVHIDITPEPCRSITVKLMSHGSGWLHIHKLEYEFPLINRGDHFLYSGGQVLVCWGSEGVFGKAHHICGQSSLLSGLVKFSFNRAMKPVIMSVIRKGDEMHLRSVGKCSILPVLKSVLKMSSLTWKEPICLTRSMTVLSLPCKPTFRSLRCHRK